jgi:hypothetical protein
MEFLDKVKAKLAPNTKAFTAVLVGSIMAIGTSGCHTTNNDSGSTDWVRALNYHIFGAFQRHHRYRHCEQRSTQHLDVR